MLCLRKELECAKCRYLNGTVKYMYLLYARAKYPFLFARTEIARPSPNCRRTNDKLRPRPCGNTPPVRVRRGIKLQFVICNSECRLIYSRRSHLPFARSNGTEGLEIKRRLMRKREGARRKGASVILFRANKQWLSARYFYRTTSTTRAKCRVWNCK